MPITLDILKPESKKSEKLFFDSTKNVRSRINYGIEKGLWLSAKTIKQEFIKQVLAKDKTGRFYVIRVNGALRKHRASAPGQTAANITGNYRRSFDYKVNIGSNPELVIGNTAEYAGFLELGTSRMKARPGLLNAINASQRDIMRNLTEEI